MARRIITSPRSNPFLRARSARAAASYCSSSGSLSLRARTFSCCASLRAQRRNGSGRLLCVEYSASARRRTRLERGSSGRGMLRGSPSSLPCPYPVKIKGDRIGIGLTSLRSSTGTKKSQFTSTGTAGSVTTESAYPQTPKEAYSLEEMLGTPVLSKNDKSAAGAARYEEQAGPDDVQLVSYEGGTG